MSETIPPAYWDNVKTIMQLFFPQYFDPDDDSYIDPTLLDQLLAISDNARPWCLPEAKQNFAQAMFTAYLITVRNETSTGQKPNIVAGPITQEREGDISVTYASATGGSTMMSKRPSSDPWDAWNRLWSLCGKGTITTRFGDPCRSGSLIETMGSRELSLTLGNYAIGL